MVRFGSSIAYDVGDVIEYSTFGGTIRRVRVTAKDPNIKNGQSGFDGESLDGKEEVWGYDDQVTRLISRGSTRQSNPLFKRVGQLKPGDTIDTPTRWSVQSAKYSFLGKLKSAKLLPVLKGKPLPVKPISVNQNALTFFDLPNKVTQVSKDTLRIKERHHRAPRISGGGAPRLALPAPARTSPGRGAAAGAGSGLTQREQSIVDVLVAMGIRKHDALPVVKTVPDRGSEDDQIRAALTELRKPYVTAGNPPNPTINITSDALTKAAIFGAVVFGGIFLWRRELKQRAEEQAQQAALVPVTNSDLIFGSGGNPTFQRETGYYDSATAEHLKNPIKNLMWRGMVS